MTTFKRLWESMMRAREGDLIETVDGNIFDVKGLVHPPDKIIAFIRFTPEPHGERKRGDERFRKTYPLQERYELLRERYPQYLVFDTVFNEWLCEVPIKTVSKHYEPRAYLRQLRQNHALQQLESQALKFARLLHTKAKVNWNSLGVSGSILAGLHTAQSDIDLVVYGSKNCERVYEALRLLIRDESGPLKPYTEAELKTLFDFRSKDTAMKFEDFVRTESRKVLQGKFDGRDYFIRCVKEWSETTEHYGSVHYEPMGDSEITAMIVDDSDSIFTPCTYRIKDAVAAEGKRAQNISEIVSFRGRFCEQARKDERINARGKVERVHKADGEQYLRLLLGNKSSDYMILDNRPLRSD